MNEKRPLLSSLDYGQDEDAALKLLAKHKALQADMGTYRWRIRCNQSLHRFSCF